MTDNENNQEPENGLGRDQERVIELLANAMVNTARREANDKARNVAMSSREAIENASPSRGYSAGMAFQEIEKTLARELFEENLRYLACKIPQMALENNDRP